MEVIYLGSVDPADQQCVINFPATLREEDIRYNLLQQGHEILFPLQVQRGQKVASMHCHCDSYRA